MRRRSGQQSDFSAGSSSGSGDSNIDKKKIDINYKKALKLINKAKKLEKRNKPIEAKEKYGDALENLLSSYERSPDDPNTLNYLGYTSRKLDDFKNAELYYLMGLKIEPNHSGINEYLGELYVITKRLDKAKERLKVLEGCKCEEYNELKNVINTGSSKY